MSDHLIKYVFGLTLIGAACGQYVLHHNLILTTQKSAAPSLLAANAQPLARVPRSDDRAMEIRADGLGQFITNVDIASQSINVLVDTGATFLSLTSADARHLGLVPRAAEFNVPVQTANGVTKAAKVIIPDIRLGHLRVSNVEALILPGDVAGLSLLGMSFLRKLGRVEVAADSLLLHP
jgi:aspartyl protease family protein